MAFADIIESILSGGAPARPDPIAISRPPIGPPTGGTPPPTGATGPTCPPGYTWTPIASGGGACMDATGSIYTGNPVCPPGKTWTPYGPGIPFGDCKDASTGNNPPGTGNPPATPCPTGQHWVNVGGGAWQCVNDSGTSPPPPPSGAPPPTGEGPPGGCPPGTHWLQPPGSPTGYCAPDEARPTPLPPRQRPPGPPTLNPRPPLGPPLGTPPGTGGAGVPFAPTEYPLWVYTGDVNEVVHKEPMGPPGSLQAQVPGSENWKYIDQPAHDIKVDPTTGLCPDGSKPLPDGSCPQTGAPPGPGNCAGLACADGKPSDWDYVAGRCMCADGSPPTNTGGNGPGPPGPGPNPNGGPTQNATVSPQSSSVAGGSLSDMVQSILSGNSQGGF